jgi:GAF domain-containing protein
VKTNPKSREFLTLLEQHARRLVSDYAISDALHDLADGIRTVLDISGAGVSLADNGELSFAIAHPEAIAGVERMQERIQGGPGVTAYRAGHPITVRDIRSERDRWPHLAAAASEVGLVAIAGIPIHLNGTCLGALSLYDDAVRDWGQDELRVAEVLAAMAAALIANSHRLDEARSTAEQLQRALESRIVIEQAKGMIASQHDISVDEAFDRLRRHARSHQLSLRSVAEAVVQLRLTLDHPCD